MRRIRPLLLATLGILGWGCEDDANEGAPAPCPAVADACRPECSEVRATRYDVARNCLTGEQVVSCQGGPLVEMAICLERSDGLLLMGSASLKSVGAVTACSDEAAAKLNVPRCP